MPGLLSRIAASGKHQRHINKQGGNVARPQPKASRGIITFTNQGGYK